MSWVFSTIQDVQRHLLAQGAGGDLPLPLHLQQLEVAETPECDRDGGGKRTKLPFPRAGSSLPRQFSQENHLVQLQTESNQDQEEHLGNLGGLI